MNIATRIKNKLILLYRREIKRDAFLREVARWFQDKGDETLRLDYPLTPDSVVFDLGGYQGDFAEAITRLYNCNVYIFEPVPEFYQHCVARFKNNPKVTCLNYGLSSQDGWLHIGLAEDATSFYAPSVAGDSIKVEVRSVVSDVKSLGVEKIDLMKINIEGGEFDVIPALIESGLIHQVIDLQVQFHHFVSDAVAKRNLIREALKVTHEEKWNYQFVWESWHIKNHDD